jgi:NADPH:quinone reductase-like Zn-dependent oxidoreductase
LRAPSERRSGFIRAFFRPRSSLLSAALKEWRGKVAVHQRFALKDAAKAQEELTAKKTVGATILTP